ncbi:MAG: hypothetical protein WC516_06305 [Patescibacteria group bacterium]|jgi:hypothetical protein
MKKHYWRIGVSFLDKVACVFGWHIADRDEANAYPDGCGRLHAWCKICGQHMPLFGDREKKVVFGKERQANFITVLDKRIRLDS